MPPRGSGRHVRATLDPPYCLVLFAFGVQRVVYLQNPDFAFSVFPPTTKILRFWKLRWVEKGVFLRKNAKSAKIASRSCCFGLLSNSVFLVFSVSRGRCELLSWQKKNASRLCCVCLFSKVDFLDFLISRIQFAKTIDTSWPHGASASRGGCA